MGPTTTCAGCSTKTLSEPPNAPLLQGITVGGIIVKSDMKKMHGQIQSMVTLDLEDDFK
jgi:hypothetical protein